MTRKEYVEKQRELERFRIREAKRLAGYERRTQPAELDRWKREIILQNERLGLSVG